MTNKTTPDKKLVSMSSTSESEFAVRQDHSPIKIWIFIRKYDPGDINIVFTVTDV